MKSKGIDIKKYLSTERYITRKELVDITGLSDREEEIKLVTHSLNDCKSRTKQLNKQKRKYIAYIKKAEQIMLEESMNNIQRAD